MGEVINLKQFKEENTPHLSGDAICLLCDHEFTAVAPVGTVFMECPQCHTDHGVFKLSVMYGESSWHCSCGNSLFRIAPKAGVYCPACGKVQQW